MSKSPRTQTTTQNTQVPAYVQEAQQNLYGTGQALAAPFTSTPPAFGVAGFTPDQEMGFELARQGAQDAYTAAPMRVDPAALHSSPMQANVYSIGAKQAPFASTGPAAQAATAQAPVEQLTAGDIAQFMNPYTREVIDTTLGDMSRKFDETSAAARARMAAAGAFGGSRQAVMENGMARDFGDTVARTAAALRDRGFTQAADLGRGNAQMRQQGGQFNAGQANQVGLANMDAANRVKMFDTAQENQVELANADAANRVGMFDIGQHNQAGRDYAAAYNAALRGDADRSVLAATTDNALANDYQARQLRALQSLLGIGGAQQQTAQSAINLPMDWLKVLGSITPGNTGQTSTTTSPSNAPSTLQQILGGGLSLLGLGTGGGSTLGGSLLSGIFSDEEEKTNKQKLGKDPKTGLDIYAYDYRGDVEAAKKSGKPMPPKRVGPMAQDVERKYPGTTRKVGGKRVIGGMGGLGGMAMEAA